MKTETHPKYDTVKVTCSCGNVFETRSTKSGEMHVELCNECHPFFTGKQKLVDTGGRVERFQKRYGDTAVKSKRARKAEATTTEKPEEVTETAETSKTDA